MPGLRLLPVPQCFAPHRICIDEAPVDVGAPIRPLHPRHSADLLPSAALLELTPLTMSRWHCFEVDDSPARAVVRGNEGGELYGTDDDELAARDLAAITPSNKQPSGAGCVTLSQPPFPAPAREIAGPLPNTDGCMGSSCPTSSPLHCAHSPSPSLLASQHRHQQKGSMPSKLHRGR